MKGTEKQIKWGEEIKLEFLEELLEDVEDLQDDAECELEGAEEAYKEALVVLDNIKAEQNAVWFIENRSLQRNCGILEKLCPAVKKYYD